jgi:hypothetical protein
MGAVLPAWPPADPVKTMTVIMRRGSPLRVLLLILAGPPWLVMAPHAPAGIPAGGKIDYNFHIRPLLAERCFPCHGPDERKRKADLRLDTAEGALESGVIVPGRPDESELVARITAGNADRMPPPKSNLTLSQEEIALIRRWVAEGAEYKPHWALLPLPDEVPAPRVKAPAWPADPIDLFILARLEHAGLAPAPPAPREAWIRRASFDLTGLPPSPAEVDAFLADTAPDAFEKVADRLLASPRFGERMATEWLDVARYADSFGYQADGDSHVWPWRDWVVRTFNANLPFDQFLTWQIAGDLLDHPSRDQRLATAFCRLRRMTNEGGSIPEEFRNEYVADRVQTFGTAILGLTVECARCHDHKFDPITQQDYYGLGAFFNSIDEWGTYDNAQFRPTPTLPLPTPEQERALTAHAAEVARWEARVSAAEPAREAVFRAWLAREDRKPEVPGLVGHYPLDTRLDKDQLENLADPKHPGTTTAANVLVPGKIGQALRFSGDDPLNLPGGLDRLDRDRPFTVAFWLQVPEPPQRAVIFHRQAGTDTGFHGAELAFDEGRLAFAMIRFWPGNALAVRTRSAFPAGRWVHVAVSSDASGRAAGARIDLDGQPADLEIVRDGLTKNLEAGGSGLTFGERFRSPGLKDGLIDEIRIYDRALSPIEVAHLADGHALDDALARRDEARLRPYYFGAMDSTVAEAREGLCQARERLFATQTGIFEIMTMEELSQPRPAFILARGRYDAPKDRPVARRTPSALPPFPNDAPRDRLGLARWLTDPRHPLTARVAVNRFWQLFFGKGLVATPENFGTLGALPSHPELLDRLARDFIASGWDTKRLCRRIVLSSTYRQRSAAGPELRGRDPENVLLGRGPSRRLSAEMLRDAALCAGGLLVEQLGGPPVKPYQPPGLWKGQNAFLPEYTPDKGPGLYRRSLYTFWRRTSPPPNMILFDAPSREVCTARRQATSTPLQPLVLLNDPQFVEAARGLGERMLREGGAATADRLAFAFRWGTSRRPSERELALLLTLHQRQLDQFQRQPKAAVAYLRTGDRPLPADLDPAALAAAAVVANAILNLDASLMIR